jgi:DUF1680 family protein
MTRCLVALVLLLSLLSTALGAPPEPRPDAVPARLADHLEPLPPAEVRLEGYLGDRVAKNEKNRLLQVDEEELLAGFRHRPGRQAWIGEHVGKWLHAATLAWNNTGDAALRAKLDRVVAELLKTQEPDGYLGTYTPDRRFGLYPGADWDVWVHKYDLIGLLTYYRYTGSTSALKAARKIGDLLIATFGPGKKSILAAGTHVGMAATSVLEPVVLLYRATGDSCYLDFARYLVAAWDEPQGPHILATLTTQKSVAKTANGKAYEMLSNLVGLCELSRATGERRFMDAPLNAWQDIVAHHLYLTGTASQHEHFHADHDLPNQPGANIGETCVTVTWIQLNAQLLRLTGAARFADELERSYYNHLAAAQRPDGAQWCYYTALEGTKPYGASTNCCLSSGPRGMALAPALAYLKSPAGERAALVVNLYDGSRVTTRVGDQQVTVRQQSAFPRAGEVTLTLEPERRAAFDLRLRVPAWTTSYTAEIAGEKGAHPGRPGEWLTLRGYRWRAGDQVRIRFAVPARLVAGEYSNVGKAALTWGPLVLAYDTRRNPGLPPPGALAFADPGQPPFTLESATGEPLRFRAEVRSARELGPAAASFVPFAEAGSDGGRYQVWLRAPGVPVPPNESLFAFGLESRSRQGNVAGAISDGDLQSFVVTFDGRPRAEDWFAVRLEAPASFRRVLFAHGRAFHDGGWFDATAGKPRVQAQREAGGAWETVGTLDDYPGTTATDAAGLREGQTFSLRLKEPVKAIALRVIGKPACGDNPAQAFASCAELQAFPE